MHARFSSQKMCAKNNCRNQTQGAGRNTMRSQTEKCLTALHPTPSLSLAPGCFPFQRKLRSLAILAGQDARPATPPSPLLNAPHHRTSSVNKIEKKSLRISKIKKVSCRGAKLLKGQKSVVLPHYQQSSSFLLTPNHFSFFPPFLSPPCYLFP